MSSSELDVLVPRDARDPIQISNGDSGGPVPDALVAAALPADTAVPSIEVSLPPELAVEDSVMADDGTSVFQGDTGSMAVQILDDGSVRMMAVLDDATAPLEHMYTFGEGIEPIQLSDGSVDLVARTEDGVGLTVVCLAAKFPAAIGKVVSSACTLIGAPTGIMALRSALATRVSSVTRYPGFCFRRVVFGPHAPEVRLPRAACG